MMLKFFRKYLFVMPVITGINVLMASSLTAKPVIRISKASLDFGSIARKRVYKEDLTISNIGNDPLSIKLRVSCDCLSYYIQSDIVLPGESTVLSVGYRSRDYKGEQKEYVFIHSNDHENEYITLLIEANVDREDITKLILFYTAGCRYCMKLKNEIIPDLLERYNVKSSIENYSIDEPDNYELLVGLERLYGDSDNKIPVIFLNDMVLGGEEEISSGLENILSGVLVEKTDEGSNVSSDIVSAGALKKFRAMKTVPVFLAGMIDGLNPCAFSVIIFLVMYLSMVKKRPRKDVLGAGLSFSLGVFVAYLLIGLGFSRVLYSIKEIYYLGGLIFIITGVFVFFLSIVSFRDYFVIRKLYSSSYPHDRADVKKSVFLKLPESFQWKIFQIIEKGASMKYIIFTAFAGGVIISILELVCTGQIYLPTIMYVMSDRVSSVGYKIEAFYYLVLYCSAFILPLIAVFFLVYLGI